ncbi:MAG TPA: hypothetical protein VNM67_00005 [Thermoanaerobaculia bacterium]|jgi:hypothetical protein|nr:hypothetical protein [Thermoanaerobaculia bacterium]
MGGLRVDLTDPPVSTFTLPVGALDGLGSLSYNLAEPLKEFSRLYEEHKHSPAAAPLLLEWDLRRLENTRINIAALTAFIAIAHRLSLFSDAVPQAKLTWNPSVFGFLADTGVVELLRRHKLVELPEREFAGYWHDIGKTNPWTRFLILDKTAEMPLPGEREWAEWKDHARRQLTGELFDYTRALFRPSKRVTFDSRLPQIVVAACAELALNANYWGRSPAVVGLQRSGSGITAAVADCGEGILRTFRDRSLRKDIIDVKGHTEAALVAAVYNRREYGLWRVIDEVTSLPNGWVSLWSFDAELHLRRPLWERVRHLDARAVASSFPIEVQRGRIDEITRRQGYLRQWSSGIRGVRAAFEISFK